MLPLFAVGNSRILIVEDHHDSRELLALILGRSGYDIIQAATGLEAIDRAKATTPDLIIMDLGLPGITGDVATARLKANPLTRHIPVLVNTAFHKGELVNQAIAAGAAEILYKPIAFGEIQKVIHRYLPPRGQNRLPLNPEMFSPRLSTAH